MALRSPLIADDLDSDLDTVDDTPADAVAGAVGPIEARRELILRARRRLTPVRRSSIQLPRDTEGPRIGRLMTLAKEGQHLAFDLELLYLALQPITTSGDNLSNGTWAHLLSTTEKERKAAGISRAWRVLEDHDLITRTNGPSTLLREDGTRAPWIHPGESEGRDRIGYFSIPRAYWLRGYSHALSLPGKAMLMILLSETNDTKSTTVTYSHARFAEYFGISESTVKRGLNDLRTYDLLGERWEKRPSARSPKGYRQVGHYWLRNPFSTQSRDRAREIDTEERQRRASTSAGRGVDD